VAWGKHGGSDAKASKSTKKDQLTAQMVWQPLPQLLK